MKKMFSEFVWVPDRMALILGSGGGMDEIWI